MDIKKLENKLAKEDMDLALSLNQKELDLNKLKLYIAASTGCDNCVNSECKKRQFVWPSGNVNAKVMIIAAPPTEYETLSHTVLSDAGGVFFSVMLSKLNLSRDNFYITSIGKCSVSDPYILGRCCEYLKEEINIIKPKMIVTLGKVTANVFRAIMYDKKYEEEELENIKDKPYLINIKDIDYNILHILDPNEVVDKAGALYNSSKLAIWKELNYIVKCMNSL